MDIQSQKTNGLRELRIKSTMGISLIGIFLLTPFSIYHFFLDLYLLGSLTLINVILCVINVWNTFRDRYNPSLIFLTLVPTMIAIIATGLQDVGLVITLWCYPLVLSLYCILPERLAWLSNIIFMAIIFPLAWMSLEHLFVIRFVITILGVSAFSAVFMNIIASQHKTLITQAMTDPLTGLLNRSTLSDELEQTIQQNHRSGTPMTLLILDLDHFKMINDKLGHSTGDDVLRNIGAFFLQHSRRSTDKVFRIGGEEFLMLLYDTDIEHSIQFAEELCSEFSSHPLLHDHPVTFSIGVATLQLGEDQKNWLKRCDKNLYQAKSDGRNQIVA